MLDLHIAEEVLAAALQNGGEFAEIFLEDRYNNALGMRNDTVETISSGRIHGAGIRVFTGVRCIYAYTNNTSRQGLLACAEKTAAAVRGAPQQMDIRLVEKSTVNRHPIARMPQTTEHTARLALMREASKAAKSYSAEIAQVQTRYVDLDQRIWIANTEGLFTQDRRIRSRLVTFAVASDGKENQTGFEAYGASRGIELFDDYDTAQAGRKAAESAVRMLHAPVCPAGVMPVVIEKGFGGVLFHEACGHSLEATSVARGQSEFAGKLGQKIASERVTAIDDGTEPGAWGSTNIDDEGVPTTKLVLIENGVLTNYMIDKLGGLRMGMPSTGSGRRESYQYAPTSRMRNTYIDVGEDDEAEMISSMGEGLYAATLGGGSVDPVTGVFNFAVDEGYLVKNGQIDTPVRGASLIGRGSEILLKIDRVGKTMASSEGMCGSLSGSVPTSLGQPTIRISSLTVGGR